MNKIENNLNEFLSNSSKSDSEEFCDEKTGICTIKGKDGLVERTYTEEKKLTKDGRQLLTEEMPVSNTSRNYIR